MSNPYLKYLGPEDHLHNSIIKYMGYQYPKWFYTHATNEGKRTAFEQFKAKFLGMKPGVPDILIFEPRQSPERFYTGLALEVKTKKNKPTPYQIAFMDRLKEKGWMVEVVYSLEQAAEVLRQYADFGEIKF